jgi:hypothetical protein
VKSTGADFYKLLFSIDANNAPMFAISLGKQAMFSFYIKFQAKSLGKKPILCVPHKPCCIIPGQRGTITGQASVP